MRRRLLLLTLVDALALLGVILLWAFAFALTAEAQEAETYLVLYRQTAEWCLYRSPSYVRGDLFVRQLYVPRLWWDPSLTGCPPAAEASYGPDWSYVVPPGGKK